MQPNGEGKGPPVWLLVLTGVLALLALVYAFARQAASRREIAPPPPIPPKPAPARAHVLPEPIPAPLPEPEPAPEDPTP